MPTYHFDLGNSIDGPVGFCAQVTAASREEAVEKLQAALPEEMPLHDDFGDEAIEYIRVYFNPGAIRVTDIDQEDE